jgi:GNAT superfamily N-acetyltransferase
MSFNYEEIMPSKEQFFELMQTTNWQGIIELGSERVFEAINQSWYAISAFDKNQLIGYGRVISDGVYQSFICDLIVSPAYQNRGIGSTILKKLLFKCKSENIVMVHLFSAVGKSEFYKNYGFEDRPLDAPGMRWMNREITLD